MSDVTVNVKGRTSLQFLVADTGEKEPAAVYVNGIHTSKFDIEAGQGRRLKLSDPLPSTLIVRFFGIDGGFSAIVERVDGEDNIIAHQTGMRHAYILES